MMVNNSTNINKANNHFSPQIIENEKNKQFRIWHGIGTKICSSQTNLKKLDNWIANDNTDITNKKPAQICFPSKRPHTIIHKNE